MNNEYGNEVIEPLDMLFRRIEVHLRKRENGPAAELVMAFDCDLVGPPVIERPEPSSPTSAIERCILRNPGASDRAIARLMKCGWGKVVKARTEMHDRRAD